MSYLIGNDEYEKRFSDRKFAPPNPKSAPNKFAQDRSIEPFYGLTCIAWVNRNQQRALFKNLCDLQNELIKKLEDACVADFFAFLRPESFHMTICDINASQDSVRCFNETIIKTVQDAFTRIKPVEKVTAQIRGIGLKATITALVKFDESELHKILRMEHEIKETVGNIELNLKRSTCMEFRNFTGHISLAYCVRSPGEEDATKIRKALCSYENKELGEFTFSQFDLTYFTDMNTYIPLLTKNLNDGNIVHHNNNTAMLKRITELFKTTRSLVETWRYPAE